MAVEHDSGPGQLSSAEQRTRACQDPWDGDADVNDLLAEVARGDEEAFEVVYDKVAGMVYGLVRGLIGDPGRSEELARDVLAEVRHTASRFDPGTGSGTCWIMTIARRRATGHLRAAWASGDGRCVPLQLSGAIREVTERSGVSLDGEQTVGGPELPEPQRHALLLALYGGYTQSQIADFLGIPSALASAHIRDGLLQLGRGGQ